MGRDGGARLRRAIGDEGGALFCDLAAREEKASFAWCTELLLADSLQLREWRMGRVSECNGGTVKSLTFRTFRGTTKRG